MYLLNVNTQQLEDIHEWRPYAILSHAWRVGETHHFHDVGTESVRIQPGYEKVEMCCELARQDGLDYVWIDTCCADANSSAARTETAMSAYTWFQQAQVCYTYLDDVDGSEDPREGYSTFRHSRWFKRAWTLQELLAPKHVFFFAKDWTMIGTKGGLSSVISSMTGIHKDALEYPERVPRFSVATRMSWAKGRMSTKEEDKVYAVMGLFGVNLPILYGEGETKTFLKLQNEIIRTTDDQSIFAWCPAAGASASSDSHASGLLLADNSTYFADCGDVQRIPYDRWSEYCAKHFCSKNITYPQLGVDPACRGVQATLPARQRGVGLEALLACARGPAVWNGSDYVANVNKADLVCIRLQQNNHGYERVDKGHLETVGIDDSKKFSLLDIHICASQPYLGLGVPSYRNWLLNSFL